MPLKKSEMEAHRAAYYALVSQARAALQSGLFDKAIEAASASWEYIDGMMQYERMFVILGGRLSRRSMSLAAGI
jgi:hypothetical protein